jgi:hypothetical protein
MTRRLDTTVKMTFDAAVEVSEAPFHHCEEKIILAEVLLRRAGSLNLAKRCADALKIMAEFEAERRQHEKRVADLEQFRLFD